VRRGAVRRDAGENGVGGDQVPALLVETVAGGDDGGFAGHLVLKSCGNPLRFFRCIL
jgi:hypothetical protein